MPTTDRCSACQRPVSPLDIQCPHCELLLTSEIQAPRSSGGSGQFSIVRRMLEAPQSGMPSSRPTRPKLHAAPAPPPLFDAPTSPMRIMHPQTGVPVVVAVMNHKQQLSELEAFVISRVDGRCDMQGLAPRVRLSVLELSVVLQSLQDQGLVSFRASPISDAELELPLIMGTLESATEPQALTTVPPRIAAVVPPKPGSVGKPVPAEVLARDTLQVALRMEQAGQLDEAIEFLERSIAQSPQAAMLYNRLGVILMRERADAPRAEAMFRKAVELETTNAVFKANLRLMLSRPH